MHVFKCFEKLIDDVLFMYFLKYACAYDNMEISFHKIEYEVKILIVLGFNDVKEAYDIIVTVELLKEHDLAESSLSIGGIMKGIEDFFESNNSFELAVNRLPYNTISALAELLNDFVFLENVRLDLFSHV